MRTTTYSLIWAFVLTATAALVQAIRALREHNVDVTSLQEIHQA